MKERSREMGLSLPTAEEIFRDYSAPRTDVVHSLTNDHHDSPLSPHPCRRGHITAVENTTIPSSCNKLGRENITILVWLLFKLVHYQQMDHVRSCQRLGIKLLCPSPSDVAPLAVLSLL
ncbi:hypothetical protein TB1_033252 [Malus domestica]